MTDFDRQPGAIDDPGMKGGIAPDERKLPPGDTAGDTGGPGEPQAAELDLPGPDDPVAWNYVEPGTVVVGSDGAEIGRVEQMLGTDIDNIFHGVAVKPAAGGPARVLSADEITFLSPSKVESSVDAEQLGAAEEYRPVEGG